MYSRVKKVFIGTDISRTASAVPFGASQAAAAGEIFVLDANRNILAAGKTVADSDTIYIAEVLAGTMTYANEAGTSITAKKVLLSDPIVGNKVKTYSGKAYTAKAEKTCNLDNITQTITVGDEYVLRIIYKDVKEHPGQKTHSYRYIAKTNANDDLYAAFASLINLDKNARVTAVKNNDGTTDTLTLTAKAIPECTTSLNDIDEFSMVDFEVVFYWIDLTNSTYKGLGPFAEVTVDTAGITYTGPTKPQGSWEVVRDAEKSVLDTQFGVTNRIWFPVRQPDFRTVKSETYDSIVIESNKAFQTPDNGYIKETKLATRIFIPNTATSNQMFDVLAALNPWMSSVGFNGISF